MGAGSSHPQYLVIQVLGLCLHPPPQLCFDDFEVFPADTVKHLLGTLLRPRLLLYLLGLRPGALLQPHLPLSSLQDLLPPRLSLEHLGWREWAERCRGHHGAACSARGTAQGSLPALLCVGTVTCQPCRGLCCELAQQLVPQSARTAPARVFSFFWRVQSPEISSKVTVPSLEPQPTT